MSRKHFGLGALRIFYVISQTSASCTHNAKFFKGGKRGKSQVRKNRLCKVFNLEVTKEGFRQQMIQLF